MVPTEQVAEIGAALEAHSAVGRVGEARVTVGQREAGHLAASDVRTHRHRPARCAGGTTASDAPRLEDVEREGEGRPGHLQRD